MAGPTAPGAAALPFDLYLFDIDGTLLDASGAGRRGLEGALEAYLGPAVKPEVPWLHGLRLDGMTDRLIIREGMTAAGRAFDDALCTRILDTYLGILERHLASSEFEILPGVEALLAALRSRGALYGLCTGNVPGAARLKLARGGLDVLFGFGENDPNGFATDGEARERVVAAALRRAATRLGRPLDPARALVIGDTPRDIWAARANGCSTLAVATGNFDLPALRAEKADLAVPNLELRHVGAFLLGEAGSAT